MKCWGYNFNGELGNGTNIDSNVPVDVVGLTSGVVAIAVGSGHACALTTTGGLKCWGINPAGQLGNGTNTDSNVPVDVLGLTSGVAEVSAGAGHNCVFTVGGTLMCWGYNFEGELGDGTNTTRNVPVIIAGLEDPSILIDDVTVNEGDAGTSIATFTVSLSATSADTITVDVATADGTARARRLRVARHDLVTFSPGTTTRTVAVQVVGDTTNEPNERFTVQLSNPVNATVADVSGIGTIHNDDGTPPLIDCDSGDDLAAEIAAAPAGATLNIAGTCVGTFFVTKKLTLNGMPGATLDGAGAGTTVITGPKPVKLIGLTITGGSSPTGRGGGVAVTGGSLTISDSTLTGNVSQGIQGAGGAVWNSGGTVTIKNSDLFGNSAPGLGGGGGAVYNALGQTMTISTSTLSGNSADHVGGAILNEGDLVLKNTALSGNSTSDTSGSGGAIWNFGSATITDSTFDGNAVPFLGGAIVNLNGPLAISDSTFDGNTAGTQGGAINSYGTLAIANSTFTANDAPTGGGIANINGAMTMTASTVSGNTASHAGGIWDQTATGTIGSSIVAGNTAASGPDCAGGPVSNGYNLIGDADGCAFSPVDGRSCRLDLGLGRDRSPPGAARVERREDRDDGPRAPEPGRRSDPGRRVRGRRGDPALSVHRRRRPTGEGTSRGECLRHGVVRVEGSVDRVGFGRLGHLG